MTTRADHPSGSDRIYEALETLDPAGQIETIVNIQGDLPAIEPAAIQAAVGPLKDAGVDIATLAAVISKDEEHINPNVVKIIGSPLGGARLRALYFTRATAPYGDGPRYHHIGLYAYRRGDAGVACRAAAHLSKSVRSWNGFARAKRGCGST